MRIILYLGILLLTGLSYNTAFAYKTIDKDGNRTQERRVRYRADCASAQAETEQNINNVRARLRSGGDVWWDGDEGQYIVPNVQTNPRSSIFAGSVWLGGFDDEGNLKLACQDYRSNNNEDFWPGPLTPDQGTIEPDTCANWDRFFKVLGTNIRNHFNNYRSGCVDPEELTDCEVLDPNDIPLDVRGWPAKGNPFFRDIHGFDLPNTDQGLAGFYDVTPDGVYNPATGDFPIIEIRGCELDLDITIDRALPDEMVFWIYNDAGGPHTASMGQPIRMEVQVQAFAYESDDELNNMTFQRYKLINRAVAPIDSTFFAMWVDPDLGCALDDYVGCDVDRAFAYTYNADPFDENCLGAFGYQSEVPIVGVDYFRGPLGPKNRDTVVIVDPNDPNQLDTIVEFSNPGIGEVGDTVIELGMSSFTYYNNPGSEPTPEGATTDPNGPTEFYNYLTGSWRDGTPFTFGGSAYNPGSTELIDYAFVDPPNDPDGWSMCALNLAPGDRRTIQASGPFRLLPGATNELIIGAVWTPNMLYPCVEDFTRLLQADAIAQNLFDNCFQLNNGPDAPDIDIIQMDRELILVLNNDLTSNNYEEGYEEVDLKFDTEQDSGDSLYTFEGYRVYQLKYPTVEASNLENPELARPLFQVDVKNGVTQIVNWEAIPNPYIPSENLFEPDVRVIGADEGIQKTFSVTRDLFATGQDARLINHREYYYLAIAYGYNEWARFNPAQGEGSGQTQAYIQGRRNIRAYTGIPRPIEDRELNATYGSRPQITRLDGKGNQGLFLDLLNGEEVRNSILDGSFEGTLAYEQGNGPLDVIVFNPIDVQNGEYQLFMRDTTMNNDELNIEDEARWFIITPELDTLYSAQTLDEINEQIVAEFGFSVNVFQPFEPGTEEAIDDFNNGAVGASIEYADPDGPQWYSFLPSLNSNELFNYIKTDAGERDEDLDPGSPLSTMGGGIMVPMYLADWKAAPDGGVSHVISPAYWDNVSNTVRDNNSLGNLNNVDIVFTSDKSKWSRCVIVETANEFWYGDDQPFSVNLPTEPDDLNGCDEIENFDLRGAPSVGKDDNDGDGLPDPDGELDPDGNPRIGMGWFPGYAIDVETGKRLNIFFGENSTYNDQLRDEVVQAFGLDDETLELIKNGRDMIWNPNSTASFNSNSFLYSLYFGGQHYVYVTDDEYDECEEYYERLIGCKGAIAKFGALINVTWAGIPLLAPETELLTYREGLIPNDAVIKLRVANGFATNDEDEGEIGTGVNNSYPAYNLVFNDAQADIADTPEEYSEELAAINVVPNPYYGVSFYEEEQNTNVVKITNLPAKCTVKIFSLDGRFIRRYDRDERRVPSGGSDPGIPSTQVNPVVEWDLRNAKGVPVSSGVYLIHVDAFEKGERVLKFFAINRQFDPSGF